MVPYFFQRDLPGMTGTFILDEDVSRHCIQVLRMTNGAALRLTNGQGHLAEAEIVAAHKKHCSVSILSIAKISRPAHRRFSLAIAFTKSKDRNEWLLEKLTETGIQDIYPIITEHSERAKINRERYEKVMISALIQSQQAILPVLHPVSKLSDFLKITDTINAGQKFVAHCIDSSAEKRSFLSRLSLEQSCLMLIGPEGDFSTNEVRQCLQSGIIPVHLGENRLRTETAGLYTCMVYNAFQDAHL
ncbi:MAG TPA: RsmE family RNA methyltransferase [Edaphocola sp.]|nr:RsmE family RNA methyltransferase [Edaphocola sp.]